MAYLLLASHLLGLSAGVQVHQHPAAFLGVAGGDAELHCSHGQADHRVMLWYQQSPGDNAVKLIGFGYTEFKNDSAEEPFRKNFKLTGDLSGDTKKTGVLSIMKLEVREHTATYFCAARDRIYTDPAYFGPGTKLTVLEPEINITKPIVEVLRPSPKECGKVKASGKSKASEKTIVCVASGFYPDHVGVEWTISGGDHNVTGRVATDPAARRRDKSYHITSRLTVSAKEFTEKTMFTCNVSFFNGMDTVYVSNFIHGDSAGGGIMTRDKYLMVTQTAKFSYGFLIIKSSIFGALLALLVWKLQRSGGKQHD